METTDFSARLDRELGETGWSRAKLAREAGLPYNRITMWFHRAGAKPTGMDILKVAKALNVSEDYLMNGGQKQPYRATDSLVNRAALLDEDAQIALLKYLEFLEAQQNKEKPDDGGLSKE